MEVLFQTVHGHVCKRCLHDTRLETPTLIIGDPLQTFTLRAFHGHSRSLEPIRIDRLHFLLVFHYVIDRSRTVSQINGDFGRKLQTFLTTHVSAEGFSLEFCNGRMGQKLQCHAPIGWWKEFDDMCIHRYNTRV